MKDGERESVARVCSHGAGQAWWGVGWGMCLWFTMACLAGRHGAGGDRQGSAGVWGGKGGKGIDQIDKRAKRHGGVGAVGAGTAGVRH